MLVKLYDLPDISPQQLQLAEHGIVIKRALALDKARIIDFVNQHFKEICAEWVFECELSLLRHPVACYIAVQNQQIIGFVSYDTSAKGFLGPLGVDANFRQQGIARALIIQALHAMEYEGYGYAIIPWVSSVDYYAKAVGAIEIPNSEPGIYQRLVNQ